MLNKTMIAIMVAAGMMLCGCSVMDTTETVMDVLDSSEIAAMTSETSETSIVIKVPQDDGAKYISTADRSQIDAGQAAGYVPLKPEAFEDELLREYAGKLYNDGYSLIDMDYMGRIQAGFGLIPNSMDYFNTGIDAEKVESLGPDAGDRVLETCVIRMTEQQYTDIMLHGCEIEYYFSETDRGLWPAETDDGVIRRTESINGNYIEYNREQGVCILHVDHTRINGGNTYYDG